MAGWLAVWSGQDASPDASHWQRALAAAERHGETVTQCVLGGMSLAAWRRATGEFPQSGQCMHQAADRRVAWVGQCLDDDGDATAEALRLLVEDSPDDAAVAALNGPFAAAVADEARRSLTLWTDRHAHYPVYVYRADGCVAACTMLSCLLPWVRQPRLDTAAMGLLLTSGELIDRMTLLAGVEVLPGGTSLRVDSVGCRERRYWRLRFEPDTAGTAAGFAGQLGERMRTAVRRTEAACSRLGVPLSGGLDSRLILGLCRDPSRVPSFTWGLPDCRDIRCAEAFALKIQSPHRIYHWAPSEFVPLWREGVERTAGGFGVQEMFVLPYAARVGEHADVILNGLAGDALLGGNFLKQSWMRENDLRVLAEWSWEWRVKPQQAAWAGRLLGGVERVGESRERWVQSICAVAGHRPVERLNEWLFENRVSRFTNCGTLLFRRAVESHSPFFDRDVIDLLLKVPMEMKWKHRLYLDVLKRSCPAAARVPWQRTGIPPAWGFRATLSAMALQRAVRLLCKPARIDPFRRLAVSDAAGWFRREWASAAEGILLDQRTLDRKLVNPDALRATWEAHRQGQDCSRVLGLLISLELFAREVLDAVASARPEKREVLAVSGS